MLLSMTGYGDARMQNESIGVAVEIRAVNNRHLKVLTKCPDRYASLENELEKRVRNIIVRGTITIAVRVKRLDLQSQYRLNQDVLKAYKKQLDALSQSLHSPGVNDLGRLLTLPGVVAEADESTGNRDEEWALICETLEAALQKLNAFRTTEGESLFNDLDYNNRLLEKQLEQVAAEAPQVVTDYRDRILERVTELLSTANVKLDSADVIREVSIFADRCDINEEITRMRSHMSQFETLLNGETSQGRKLEFLSQEMFREVNTIGSKANSVTIAHAVVEMKSAVEKMRELLQNVE